MITSIINGFKLLKTAKNGKITQYYILYLLAFLGNKICVR